MPYVQLIARANGIADLFDLRVVDAYWIGNELLDRVNVERRTGLYGHILAPLRDDVPAVWLAQLNDLYALRPDVAWQPRADSLILAREFAAGSPC